MPNLPRKIIVHHDGASRSGTSFDIINGYHKGLGWPVSRLGFYAGYHYVIERNGKLRQAREDDEVGAHTIGENSRSIGICLAGNFDIELPTTAQIKTLGELMLTLVQQHSIRDTEVYPHRTFSKKACYGKRLHDLWAREVLADARGSAVALDTSPRSVVENVISKLQTILPKLT